MSSKNRQKRVENRQTRISAIEEARQRARRRRWEVAVGGVLLALIVAIVFVAKSKSGNDSTASKTPGNCVKVSDPLPKGAPAVPVKVGPPPTTLVKTDLKVGKGAVVTADAHVSVMYIGVACSTGKIFDSSYDTGNPSDFSLDQVIKGWKQGIPGMHVGGERLLGIPPDLGYGPTGSGDLIGPNESLWFVVKVLSTK